MQANDTVLTERMLPTLKRTAGFGGLQMIGPVMGSEDFPVFAKTIPSVFFFLGVTPKDKDLATASPNHSPLFFADEGALETGVRAMANLAADYLATGKVRQ